MRKNEDIMNVLLSKLRTIYDDREFLLGVMTLVSNEEDSAVLLDFINTEKISAPDKISLAALELNRRRKKK